MTPPVLGRVRRRYRHLQAERELGAQIRRVEEYLSDLDLAQPGGGPVWLFNASTRIHRLSLNAAFSLLAGWALRARGHPVRYAVCHSAMTQCVLGALWDRPDSPPPCGPCLSASRKLFPTELTLAVERDKSVLATVGHQIEGLGLAELAGYSFREIPLGELCLPALRWALRRHHLVEDETTLGLYRRFVASAASLSVRFADLMEMERPSALVVFNGIMYPEAVARWVAKRYQVPVVTHEVGLRPYSAFFSHREATFREVQVEEGSRLSVEDRGRLDSYLADRRQGRFSMAGIEFWPKIEGLPVRLETAIAQHDQLVTIFTNVVFDTSQIHANTLYPDMFAWLEDLAGIMEAHPETLFVLRAHPDEDRPGKQSQESVSDWVAAGGLASRRNVVFLPPSEYVSSYALVDRSKFVLVYNSSIGLEASIAGTPVLCAGRARYTQVPSVVFPESRAAFEEALERWLGQPRIDWPAPFIETGRAFLYRELFQASLDLSPFLAPYPEAPGMVVFRPFEPHVVREDPALEVISQGILGQGPFMMPAVPAEPTGDQHGG